MVIPKKWACKYILLRFINVFLKKYGVKNSLCNDLLAHSWYILEITSYLA
jgi:hypothetical protein